MIEVLLQSSDNKLHCHCRNKSKLLSQRPQLTSNPNVTIFEGALSDTSTLSKCLTGTRAIFLATAASENIPGCTVARDQATAVLAALESSIDKSSRDSQLPTLVVLSSASLEDDLMEGFPRVAKAITRMAFSNIYADLRHAERILRSEAPERLPGIRQVYVKPGALVHDPNPVGHRLSTDHQESFLSFLDLAAGMVEIAESGVGDGGEDDYDGKNVAVVPARPGTRAEVWLPYIVGKGLLWHFCPWLYPWLGNWLP